LEVELWTSLDGKDSMDLEVGGFVGMIDRQRRRYILRMDAIDKKNEIWVQVLLITKVKKKQNDW